MSLPEVWLRGPIDGIPALLQPVAHALLQAREEIQALMQGFPDNLLWQQPAGMASPGFHLQHLSGVLDRLFTYARGQVLTDGQLQALRAEGTNPGKEYTTALLVKQFEEQVESALAELATVSAETLTEFRGVGRAQLPSTKLGLYVHGAEHTMRHLGQLLVTVKFLLFQTASQKA
jgi:hypothetical protein